jgi:hypothetical protein
MNDIQIPDLMLTIWELPALCPTMLEDDWELFEGDNEGRLKMALTGVMLVGGFASWNESSIQHPDAPHVPLILAGRFKGEIVEKLFVNHWLLNQSQG